MKKECERLGQSLVLKLEHHFLAQSPILGQESNICRGKFSNSFEYVEANFIYALWGGWLWQSCVCFAISSKSCLPNVFFQNDYGS